MLNSTERFSSRVDDYIKYRPYYPQDVIQLLTTECNLTPSWTVGDIGSGPGNLSRLFLDNGNRLYGVEPNKEMREAGERLLSQYDGFISVNGTAEASGLPDRSVELVTAGQAFHWFEPLDARKEFTRILKPGGWVALVWNDRNVQENDFSVGYEKILWKYAHEYPIVNHKGQAEDLGNIEKFFGRMVCRAGYPSSQHFDEQGFLGRAFSSSYVPQLGQHGHEEIVAALKDLFAHENVDGKVSFIYDTQVFYGRLD